MLHSSFCGPQFRERLEQLVQRGAAHPKMETLLKILLHHFTAAPGWSEGAGVAAHATAGGGAEAGASGGAGGRVIVFTNLRESVSAIAEVLKRHSPIIDPRHGAHPQAIS